MQGDINFVEQLIASNQHSDKESAFRTFMDKMNLAEKSVQELLHTMSQFL